MLVYIQRLLLAEKVINFFVVVWLRAFFRTGGEVAISEVSPFFGWKSSEVYARGLVLFSVVGEGVRVSYVIFRQRFLGSDIIKDDSFCF